MVKETTVRQGFLSDGCPRFCVYVIQTHTLPESTPRMAMQQSHPGSTGRRFRRSDDGVRWYLLVHHSPSSWTGCEA
jgi:hypothetical protein